MTCSSLIVVVLQELKGRGQGPVCSALMLRCAGLAPWTRHLGQPPTSFWNTQTQTSPPCHTQVPQHPSGWNNFLLAMKEASGSVSASDSGMCAGTLCVLVCYWPCIMQCRIPEMALQNCLMSEQRLRTSKYWMLSLVSSLSIGMLGNNKRWRTVHTLHSSVSLMLPIGIK